MTQDNLPPGKGGDGGSARVEGDGLAIGGPGGRVVGDARDGRGGDGGGGGIGTVAAGGEQAGRAQFRPTAQATSTVMVGR
jgi:hypothetical protein